VVHTSERAPEGALLCRRRLADYAEAADGSRQPLALLRGQPLQAHAVQRAGQVGQGQLPHSRSAGLGHHAGKGNDQVHGRGLSGAVCVL
jgi:hypothetical protein